MDNQLSSSRGRIARSGWQLKEEPSSGGESNRRRQVRVSAGIRCRTSIDRRLRIQVKIWLLIAPINSSWMVFLHFDSCMLAGLFWVVCIGAEGLVPVESAAPRPTPAPTRRFRHVFRKFIN